MGGGKGEGEGEKRGGRKKREEMEGRGEGQGCFAQQRQRQGCNSPVCARAMQAQKNTEKGVSVSGNVGFSVPLSVLDLQVQEG